MVLILSCTSMVTFTIMDIRERKLSSSLSIVWRFCSKHKDGDNKVLWYLIHKCICHLMKLLRQALSFQISAAIQKALLKIYIQVCYSCAFVSHCAYSTRLGVLKITLLNMCDGVLSPGGSLEYKCCTHAWPEIFKTGKAPPKREFHAVCSQIYP